MHMNVIETFEAERNRPDFSIRPKEVEILNFRGFWLN